MPLCSHCDFGESTYILCPGCSRHPAHTQAACVARTSCGGQYLLPNTAINDLGSAKALHPATTKQQHLAGFYLATKHRLTLENHNSTFVETCDKRKKLMFPVRNLSCRIRRSDSQYTVASEQAKFGFLCS